MLLLPNVKALSESASTPLAIENLFTALFDSLLSSTVDVCITPVWSFRYTKHSPMCSCRTFPTVHSLTGWFMKLPQDIYT